MNEIDKETQNTLELIKAVEPTKDDAPLPAARAWARLNHNLQASAGEKWSHRFRQFMSPPGRRYVTASVLALFLFLFTFSFPTVRTTAADILRLFRVQNFAAITISPEQIAVLEKIAAEGAVPGEIRITSEPGQLTPVDSFAEAKEMTGLATVRSPRTLGEPEQIYVSAGGGGFFTIDLEGARSILESVGADPYLLSDELDNASVEVAVFAGVAQQWDGDLHLLQSESPLVNYPDGLETEALGQALLQLLGLNDEEAARLAQEIDWTSTLLLPIPQDIATYNEVTVDGVSGIAISSLDGQSSTILWQKDGIIYTLIGHQTVMELVQIANTLN